MARRAARKPRKPTPASRARRAREIRDGFHLACARVAELYAVRSARPLAACPDVRRHP